jgi:tetratricopeptide (TPR) repeat protein
MMQIRAGQYGEGIRYLAEANRVDAGCTFVVLQMGIALVGTGGDTGMAVRTLQRALGPKGFGMWAQAPERAWIEAFPEGHSYVRRLATKHPFICPLLGNDLNAVTRQGRLALAQALYRQGSFQDAADLFGKLLNETPPTAVLLRGFGLSLARLGRYDQAYKHLRTALEQEEPKDPFTAGYLALCGAMGKPTQPEDKPRNVLWALKLIARFHGQMAGNAEWASLANTIHAEARALNLAIPIEDQVFVCDALASVRATDPLAAEAYAYLFNSFPDALQPVHAYLYSQASHLHRLKGDHDLPLFARAFEDADAARAYFAKQKWDYDDLEYTFLERSAAKQPGRFPEALGPDYAAKRGEAFLVARSREQEERGNKDAAMGAIEVMLRLSPKATAGHDRLACLHYRRGDMDRAVALLSGWQRLAPHDHWPLVRQAIIEQQRGNAERRAKAIDQALGLTRGPVRAAVAYLGARLALQAGFRKPAKPAAAPRESDNGVAEPPPSPDAVYAPALYLLQECLREEPDHVDALWCLAAVRTCLGDEAGLAEQAAAMNRPAVKDARFHYLGAVCHLAARDYYGAIELSRRAAADEALAVESNYLMAWAHLHMNDPNAAGQALQKVVSVKTPSADHARALLGKLSFARGDYDDAIKWWNAVDAARRAEWHFDEPLRQTVYLAGLTALDKEKFEQAADRFREAGKLGLRDRRLGGLLTLALIKAGQRLLFEQAK